MKVEIKNQKYKPKAIKSLYESFQSIKHNNNWVYNGLVVELDPTIDFKKNNGWIHISQLKKGKSLILLKDQILFSKPTRYSKPIIKISKGRLLLVKKCKKKWCKVKTENYFGWIRTNNIWGNIK